MAQLPFYVAPPRPVVDNWKCHQSGDCCKHQSAVRVTGQEKEYLERVLTVGQLYKLNWRQIDTNMWEWDGRPCPLLGEGANGKMVCTIHEHKPYNCRRFACMRPDPKTEPFQPAPLSPYLKYGNIGCANLRDRLVSSRVARRTYALIQRKAQRWAVKYGWGPANDGTR